MDLLESESSPSITPKRPMPTPVAQHDDVPMTVLSQCLATARTLG
jgi:hypothetical protein